MGIGARQHDQTDCLRNRHKVADDIRMSDSDRTSLGNLSAEDWYDRTIGTEDIAKSNGDKFCFDVLKLFFITMNAGFFDLRMRKELGNFAGTSLFDHSVKALDDHLAQTLGGTHDIGGIDRLISGDQDKALAAVYHGRIGSFIRANRIVFDCLTGTVFHEGHMLVCGGMIDDLRAIVMKDFKHAPAVADRSDQNLQIQVGIFLAKLKLYIIGIVFIDIENDELPGIVCGSLAAQLRADGSAAACDHDRLPVNEVEDLPHIRLDRFTAQKVLNRNRLHV